MCINQTFVTISCILAIFCIWALDLFNHPALAQGLFENAVKGEETTTQESYQALSQSFFSPSRIDFSGYVRTDLFIGKVPGKNLTEIKNGYGEVATKLQSRLGVWGVGLCELRFNHGYDGEQIDSQVGIREAYVDLFPGSLDIRFGHQIIAWGRADGINPTDNLTPKNLRTRSPDQDDRRAGNLALRIIHYLRPLRTELVYVPYYAPSYFPVFELPDPIQLDDADYPDTQVEHATVAGRIHLMLPSVELSLSYLFGHASFPGLSLTRFNPDPNQFELVVNFRAYQHHVIGMDFSTTVGERFGLRGEAALKLPKERDTKEHVPLPELQVVLGLDRDFGELSVILQYIGKGVFNWNQRNNVTPSPENMVLSQVRQKTRMVAGQSEHFSHAMFLRLTYRMLQETLSFELVGMGDFSTEEWMARAIATYDITDGLAATLGAEIFGGPDDTLNGTIDQNMSAGFVELKAYF